MNLSSLPANTPLPDPLAPLTDLARARQAIIQWQAAAHARGVVLRHPPPEPTTCCGRGCNGCVWEGFYEALFHWQADADAALRSAAPHPPHG